MDKIAKTLKNISNKVYIVEKWVLMIAVIAVTAVNFVSEGTVCQNLQHAA